MYTTYLCERMEAQKLEAAKKLERNQKRRERETEKQKQQKDKEQIKNEVGKKDDVEERKSSKDETPKSLKVETSSNSEFIFYFLFLIFSNVFIKFYQILL